MVTSSFQDGASAMVFAPAPLLTITIERRGEDDDIHLHAGGQGFWIARMLASLGLDAVLCGSFGGETGMVVQTLIESEGVRLHPVPVESSNPAYVHDRRNGERVPVSEARGPVLSRHEVDALYNAALVEGLDADVSVLGGPTSGDVLPPDTYRRLAADLSRNGRSVVVDLSGPFLTAAVHGQVAVVKVSDDELLGSDDARSASEQDLVAPMVGLHAAGATYVVVSRSEQPPLALIDNQVVRVIAPRLEPLDARGAGDSMTAGLAAGLARRRGIEAAVRLGAAAGGLNVTRHGLATGRGAHIQRLLSQVRLVPGPSTPTIATTTPDELAAKVRP